MPPLTEPTPLALAPLADGRPALGPLCGVRASWLPRTGEPLVEPSFAAPLFAAPLVSDRAAAGVGAAVPSAAGGVYGYRRPRIHC